MDARSFFVLSLALSSFTVHPLVGAQETQGKILGTVRDTTGGVLPGASVRLLSPSLFGGVLESAANERGDFRFVGLPPGGYTLEVRQPGFSTFRVEGLLIRVGTTLHRDPTLSVGAEESITVREETPLIDRRKSGVSTSFGPELQQTLPRLRSDLADFIRMAPGISASRPTSTSNQNVSAFGSGINENLVLVDGLDQTEPWAGNSLPFMSTDSVEEVEILSNGASAEFGNYQGAVINVVTRSGGAIWRADGSYYQQFDALAATGPTLECRCSSGETGYTNLDRRDATFQLGGPIATDRLWVFGSFQYRRIQEGFAGGDPEIVNVGWEKRFFEKLTFQPTPAWTLRQTYQDGTKRYPDTASAGFPASSGVTWWQRGPVLGLSSDYVASRSTLVDVRFTGDFHDYGGDPHSGKSTPPHYDLATGEYTGGSYMFGRSNTNRVVLNGKLTHYADDFLSSGHEIKFGVQFSRGWNHDVYGYPGGVFYFDYGGQPYLAYAWETDSSGGQVQRLGVFAEDVIEVGDRLTVNLGLRFDRNVPESQDLPAVDAQGEPTGKTIRGLGTLFTWNTVAPRLGATLALDREARTLVRASWGRFYQGAFAGEFDQLVPGRGATTTRLFDPATGEFAEIQRFDPTQDLGFDPGMKTPFTDQFSVGLDRQVGRRAAVGISYVRKRGASYTGWEDVGGIYGTDTATLADGRTFTVFPLLNDPSERFYELTNPDGFYLRYQGLVATFEKRFSGRWQAAASYTLSESVGLQAASLRGAGAQDSSGGFIRQGRDPNDFINADGNLPNDRRHMIRVQGSVQVPKLEVLVAASFQHLSGSPWGPPTARVRLPQGGRWIRLEPRGTVVLPSQNLLDVRLSKPFSFGGGRRIEVLVDVLNALDDDAHQRVFTTNFFSPNYAQPAGFLRPRRAMVGVKASF